MKCQLQRPFKTSFPKQPGNFSLQTIKLSSLCSSLLTRPSLSTSGTRKTGDNFSRLSTLQPSSFRPKEFLPLQRTDFLSGIISQCQEFFEKNKREFLVGKFQSVVVDNKSCFKILYNNLVNTDLSNNFPDKQFKELLAMLDFVIFIERPRVPIELIIADSPNQISFGYFAEMNIAYKVLTLVIQKTQPANLKEYITPAFLKKFVYLLNIPDTIEQQSIRNIIIQILKVFPKYKDVVKNTLFSMIQDHIENIIPHFCINPITFILNELISTGSIKINLPQLYSLLHLFHSKFLSSIYTNINILFSSIFKNFPELKENVKDYLRFHWPKKEFSISYYFLHQYIYLLQDTPESELPQYKFLVEKYKECISTSNLSCLLNTLGLLGDQTYYKTMIGISPDFKKIFQDSEDMITINWSPYISQTLSESLKKIEAAFPQKDWKPGSHHSNRADSDSDDSNKLKLNFSSTPPKTYKTKKSSRRNSKVKLSWKDIQKIAIKNK